MHILPRMVTCRHFLLAIPTLLIFPAAAVAGNGVPVDGEATFHQAERYTVRVRTSIKLPFDSDEQGTFDGAGFLVDSERGWILTNAHVAGRSPSTIQIAFKDRDYRPATKLYVDPLLDLAVVALNRSDVPPGTTAAKLDCLETPAVIRLAPTATLGGCRSPGLEESCPEWRISRQRKCCRPTLRSIQVIQVGR